MAGGVSWLRSGFDNAFKEKQNPAIPIAGLADALEEFVVRKRDFLRTMTPALLTDGLRIEGGI
ncbi:hypothetical protein [Bradyrhizobium sp. 172]|uniref:hypothetical protein n=1 Tax=Bradyrhizobium sp. 172 TaxID=2782643 RepID=UPI001FFF295D|nr:hypothetical protein [Bradyrhizobium sp. 172]UPK00237.1 hypothetical protein IVB07_38885 [Bradyrhizobium sp. 172]